MHEIKGGPVAEIISTEILVSNGQDALELLANCGYQGAEKMIIHQHHINPAFFDLKTGIAGDVLQKFSTYRMPLAIVGKFDTYDSKSLADFIFESNKNGKTFFTSTVQDALEKFEEK